MTSFMNQRKHLDTTMSDHMNNFINRYKFDCSNTNKHKQQLAKTSRGSYNIEEFKKYYTENAKLLKGLEDCISILQLLESIEPWKNLAIIAKLLTQRSSSLLI
jgi:U3 small nucleolar RNA-associated protein 14